MNGGYKWHFGWMEECYQRGFSILMQYAWHPKYGWHGEGGFFSYNYFCSKAFQHGIHRGCKIIACDLHGIRINE